MFCKSGKNGVIVANTLWSEMLMTHGVQQQGTVVSVFRSKDKASTEMPHCCQHVTYNKEQNRSYTTYNRLVKKENMVVK